MKNIKTFESFNSVPEYEVDDIVIANSDITNPGITPFLKPRERVKQGEKYRILKIYTTNEDDFLTAFFKDKYGNDRVEKTYVNVENIETLKKYNRIEADIFTKE